MKLKRFRFLKYLVPAAVISVVPIIATSCSSVYSTNLKSLSFANWKEEGKGNTYATLSEANVSIKDAIYGSNYNNGNYIFIYGTIGSESSSALADLLYGKNGNNGTGNIVVNGDKNLNFSTSLFLTTFFNEGNGTKTGGLGSKNSILGYSVSILSYIDFAPYNPNASSINGLSGSESPLAQYTQDEVLNELNNSAGGQVYTIENMPDEAKAKIGTYKRNDRSAIEYRDLLNYIKSVRPGAANTTDTYGLIAFKNGKAPQTFPINDPTSLNTSLIQYYQSTE